jgi:hypothetical protein
VKGKRRKKTRRRKKRKNGKGAKGTEEGKHRRIRKRNMSVGTEEKRKKNTD